MVDTVVAALDNMVEKWKFGFRLDEPSVAYADDIVVLATLQQAQKQMILDLREGLKK